MQRAYSVLEIKSFDEESRIIEGIATTPTPDHYNDIVEPMGMAFDLPLPLLNQHNTKEPIGNVIEAKVTKSGIRIRAEIAPAGVLDYVDRAWAQLKAKLVRGLSIGFKGIEESLIKETGGIHYMKSRWLELSAVTIPANIEATITAVKSADASLLAIAGERSRTVRLGSTTTPSGYPVGSPGSKNMTVKEQIDQFENKRAASVARMDALMTKAGEEGRTLDETESEEYDGLQAEIVSIDGHLTRLKAHQKTMLEKATPISSENTSTPEKAAATRGGNIVRVQVEDQTPKGVGFTRAIMALASCKGNRYEAAQQAMMRWPDMGEAISGIIKAEVLPGTTTGTTWAAPLMQSSARLVGEFIELARAASLVGRIPGLRRVPFNVTVPAQTGGGTYGWVGENAPKPVSSLSLGTAVVRLTKIAGIVVYTKEALRLSDPSIETTVRNDMVRGTATYMDTQFVDPAVHLSIGVNPASITDQIVPTAASGLTATFLRNDLRNIMGKFVANNQMLETAVFLMSGAVALNISSMVNAFGQNEFPGMTATGGTLLGVPVIVSQSVGARIILMQPDEILFAEDPGGAMIDVSEEASVIMDTAPASSPTSAALVSLYQRNLIGLRVDFWVSWTRATTSSVEYISSAVYSG